MKPNTTKKNCWESRDCGVDKPDAGFTCPAYPNFGRVCWAIAGTMCGGTVQGVYAKKIGNCAKCPFYISIMDRKEP